MGKRVQGPLTGLEDGFRAELAAQGYKLSSAEVLMAVMRDLSRWLASEGLDPTELTTARLEGFVAARRAAGRRRHLGLKWLSTVLEFLCAQGLAPAGSPEVEVTPLEALLGDYRAWMITERDLAARTIGRYEATARLFLSERARAGGGSGVEGLVAADVTAFLVAECGRVSVGSAQGRVAELRALLRFLHLRGLTPLALSGAVPGVAGWHGVSLPAVLSATEVGMLLASCDRSRAIGRRDFAILSLLARLGLRSAEVAGLELADLDWRAGEIVIRGKGRRADRLPLPGDVGEALVAYLAGGRPVVGCRGVFIRGRAPLVGIAGATVTTVVRFACRRAGMAPVGAHRLRHAAAAHMLAQGAPLAEIAQVLRHRDLATTAAYAKVDRAALIQVARPWPGVAS